MRSSGGPPPDAVGVPQEVQKRKVELKERPHCRHWTVPSGGSPARRRVVEESAGARLIGAPHELQNGDISAWVAPQAGQRITGSLSLAVWVDLRVWRGAHATVGQPEFARQDPHSPCRSR